MDKYKQIKVIYRTGSVEVTKNINVENNLVCCLKVLNVNDIEDATYLSKEINNLHSLRNSPHFVKMMEYIYLGTGREIEKICIVTKYYEKGDLGKELEKREKSQLKFDEKELESHIKFLLEGFKHLQENEISHRDIKPENIFIDDNNNLIIGDLGSCNTQLYEKQTIIGSMHYMSPEVRYCFSEFQKGNVGPRVVYNAIKSDVWSLGLTFLYMISMKNVREFSDPTMIDVNINKRINVITNPVLKGLLERMVKKIPEERMDFIELYEYYTKELNMKIGHPQILDPILPLNSGPHPKLEPVFSLNIPPSPKLDPIPLLNPSFPPKLVPAFPINTVPPNISEPPLHINKASPPKSEPALPINIAPSPELEPASSIIIAPPPKLVPAFPINRVPHYLSEPPFPISIASPPKSEPAFPINIAPPPKLTPAFPISTAPPKLEPNFLMNRDPPFKQEPSHSINNVTPPPHLIYPQGVLQPALSNPMQINNPYQSLPSIKTNNFSTSLNSCTLPKIPGPILQSQYIPQPPPATPKTQEITDIKIPIPTSNENPPNLNNYNPPNDPALTSQIQFIPQSEILDNKNLTLNPNPNENYNQIIINPNEKNENYSNHNKLPAPASFPKPQFQIPENKIPIVTQQNPYISSPIPNSESQVKNMNFNYNPMNILPPPKLPKSINSNYCQFCHKSENLIQCDQCYSKAHPFCMSLYNKKCILCPPTFNIGGSITLLCTTCNALIDIKDVKACNHTYCLKCRQSINCSVCTEITSTLSKTLRSKGFDDNYEPICHICKKPNNLIQCNVCENYLHAYCFNYNSQISECKNHIDKMLFKLGCNKCKKQFFYNQVKFCNHLNCDECQMLESNCKYCFEFEVVDEVAKCQPPMEMRCQNCQNYFEVQGNSYVCERDRIRLCIICKAPDHQGPCIFSDTKSEAYCPVCLTSHQKLPHQFTFDCPVLKTTFCLICQSFFSEKSHLNCSSLYQSSNLP